MPSDIDTARNAAASGLRQGHRVLQWLTRAQALQADALKAWATALETAASQAEQAALQSMLRPCGALAGADQAR